jgi:hypothetical protein
MTLSNIEERIYRALRDRYKKLSGVETGNFKSKALINIRGQAVSDLISEAILNKSPFMLSRFGSEEISWYVHYKLLSKSYPLRVASFITCKTNTWRSEGKIIDNMTVVPKSIETTESFITAMDHAIPQIDLLGSWLKLEQSDHIKLRISTQYTFLVDIEPYYHEKPWSASLKGKKVLVIHPMVKTIVQQYSKRKWLFSDENVLPEFELLTLQAKYFDDPIYNTWQKIYDYYLDSVAKSDFDVAILGCGSWGMPVASQIKKMGKVAIHLGGATQVLFGIIGSRWEEQYPGFKYKFMNESWVRPSEDETPAWASQYDGKSYW